MSYILVNYGIITTQNCSSCDMTIAYSHNAISTLKWYFIFSIFSIHIYQKSFKSSFLWILWEQNAIYTWTFSTVSYLYISNIIFLLLFIFFVNKMFACLLLRVEWAAPEQHYGNSLYEWTFGWAGESFLISSLLCLVTELQ